MKTTIKFLHTYASGFTAYDVTFATDFCGYRNKKFFTCVVATKETFSKKELKKWAAEQGYDIDALFTNFESLEQDNKIVKKLVKDFANAFSKGLEELNSSNKCEVSYSATLNPNYEPLETAFETILAYDVKVTIEFKSGVINAIFHSQGRKKNEACKMITFSNGKLTEIYEEEEAIMKIKSRIEKYINACDSMEKFETLTKQLAAVQKELNKYMK